jgi:hypothetical protein
MATRLNRNHTESCLSRIKASQLLNRIQDHGLGKLEMTKTQLQAACWTLERILARAVAPQDLNLRGDLKVEIVRFSDPPSR